MVLINMPPSGSANTSCEVAYLAFVSEMSSKKCAVKESWLTMDQWIQFVLQTFATMLVPKPL